MKNTYLQYKVNELRLLIRDDWPDDDIIPEEVRIQLDVLIDIEDEIQGRHL